MSRGGVLRDRKVKTHSIVMVFIEEAPADRVSLAPYSRERTRPRPLRGLVKVYDQVIEHPCLSRFLGADLSRRNADDGRQQVFPSTGCLSGTVVSWGVRTIPRNAPTHVAQLSRTTNERRSRCAAAAICIYSHKTYCSFPSIHAARASRNTVSRFSITISHFMQVFPFSNRRRVESNAERLKSLPLNLCDCV